MTPEEKFDKLTREMQEAVRKSNHPFKGMTTREIIREIRKN